MLGAAQNVNRCIYKGRGILPHPSKSHLQKTKPNMDMTLSGTDKSKVWTDVSTRDGSVQNVKRFIKKGRGIPKCQQMYLQGTGKSKVWTDVSTRDGHSKMSTDVSSRDGEVESLNRCIYKGWVSLPRPS